MVNKDGTVSVTMNPVKADVRLTKIRAKLNETLNKPVNVARTLEWHVDGACYVKPDPKEPGMIAVGALTRVGCLTYFVTNDKKKAYADYVREHFYPCFTPLEPGEHTNFDEWVEELDFPESRKAELREAYDRLINTGYAFESEEWLKWFTDLCGFIKDEFYDVEKASRWINARGDIAKVFFGPMAQDVMNVLKKHPAIIKTVPTEDRPQLIIDRLFAEGAEYQATDYTSFEAHFVDWLMEISGRFYCHILRNHPNLQIFKMFYKSTICGVNRSKMRGFGSFIFLCLRCSGEMDTSLGNTFHNLATYLFLVHKNGGTCAGFVEGDDGLFKVTPPSAAPTERQFVEMGWIIKILVFKVLGDSSFCGNVFAHDDLIVVTDPRKVLLTLGWAPRRYINASPSFLRSLLKSKVLSMACNYGRNPIIWALAKNLMNHLVDVKVKQVIIDHEGWYHRKELLKALEEKFDVGPPPVETRMLVQKLYGIDLDLQLQVEQELLNAPLAAWKPPDALVTEKHRQNWDRYVSEERWVFNMDRASPAWTDQLTRQCPGQSIANLEKYGGMYNSLVPQIGYCDFIEDTLGTLQSFLDDFVGGKQLMDKAALSTTALVKFGRKEAIRIEL